MSENESFIDEVTEEVRRDKLYLLLKKYGWIGVAAIVLVILISIFFELRSNARIAASEERGDFLAEALSDTKENGNELNKEILDFFQADSFITLMFNSRLYEQNSEFDNMKRTFETIANSKAFSSSFKSFAKLKWILLENDDLNMAEETINQLITPDNPFRLLALEQKVLIKIKQQNWKDAQENLDLIIGDPNISQGLRSRTRYLQNAITFGSS